MPGSGGRLALIHRTMGVACKWLDLILVHDGYRREFEHDVTLTLRILQFPQPSRDLRCVLRLRTVMPSLELVATPSAMMDGGTGPGRREETCMTSGIRCCRLPRDSV